MLRGASAPEFVLSLRCARSTRRQAFERSPLWDEQCRPLHVWSGSGHEHQRSLCGKVRTIQQMQPTPLLISGYTTTAMQRTSRPLELSKTSQKQSTDCPCRGGEPGLPQREPSMFMFGHYLPLATGNFLASRLAELASLVTTRPSPEGRHAEEGTKAAPLRAIATPCAA